MAYIYQVSVELFFINNYLVIKSYPVKTFISAIYQEQFCLQALGIGKLRKKYYYSIELFFLRRCINNCRQVIRKIE